MTKNTGQLLAHDCTLIQKENKWIKQFLLEISYVFSHKINIVAEASITLFCKYEIGKPILYPLYVQSNIDPKWLFIMLNKFFLMKFMIIKTGQVSNLFPRAFLILDFLKNFGLGAVCSFVLVGRWRDWNSISWFTVLLGHVFLSDFPPQRALFFLLYHNHNCPQDWTKLQNQYGNLQF